VNLKYTNLQVWPSLARQGGYSAATMARLLGITTRHLRRLIRKHFGHSTRVWLNEQWSLVALEMLEESDSVKWVACELGLSESNFSHRFKRYFGLSPTEFLTQKQKIRVQQEHINGSKAGMQSSFESEIVHNSQEMST
jgi:AraC-like DNA-binding protein